MEESTVTSEKSKIKIDHLELVDNLTPVDNLVKVGDIDNKKKYDKDNLISHTLNYNIPLKLKMEINRNEKCSKIIDNLKGFSELNLEQNENYSEFVILSGDNYIEQDMIIDEAFLNNEKISIYELLNNKGIKYMFNYNDIPKSQTVLLSEQKLESLNKNENHGQNIQNKRMNR